MIHKAGQNEYNLIRRMGPRWLVWDRSQTYAHSGPDPDPWLKIVGVIGGVARELHTDTETGGYNLIIAFT